MIHTFHGEGSTVTAITYATLDEVVAVLFPEGTRDDDWIIGTIVPMTDVPGKPTVADAKATIRKNHRCWGFARRFQSEIHAWIGPRASFGDVLNLFAHEYGHLEPRQDDEECRADSFARVAVRAFETAKEVMWSEAVARA